MFSELVHSTRTRQRQATRDRVIGVAQTMFAERGYRATTVRAIAAAADVSVGTVMAVGDKDALLLAAFDEWIGAVHRSRTEESSARRPRSTVAREDREEPSVGERVGRVVGPFLDLFGAMPEVARAYGVVLARGEHRTAVFAELADALHADLTQVFADAGFGDRAGPAARTVYLAYLGLVMTSAATDTGVREIRDQVEATATALVDLARTAPPVPVDGDR